MASDTLYILRRKIKAAIESIPFYLWRLRPIQRSKIVFCTIEGTTGFTCNPKYIALELLRRCKGYDLVWLVNDMTKPFPRGIRKVHNTLWNRARELSTAAVWVDNSRKQLDVRKRKGQFYLQTWHAKLGFKPTCLDRGASFSRIAYLVSKHDSDMIDLVLSNSDWYDRTLPTGMIYTGPTLRSGSPRCDILIGGRDAQRRSIREQYRLAPDTRILMYCPTFRGGSQATNRTIEKGDHAPDYNRLLCALCEKFGGRWVIFLRLHPQLTARHIAAHAENQDLIDVSTVDDMYELLAACDAFLTDYSSAAFDAAVMNIPVFLYCDDYSAYEGERGKLLWDLRDLPFPLAEDDGEMGRRIAGFQQTAYLEKLGKLFRECGVEESGEASKRVADVIEQHLA